MRRNSPTSKELVVADERDLDAERDRLRGLMDRFIASGTTACTSHPHAFFGKLTPDEWAVLMYKHVGPPSEAVWGLSYGEPERSSMLPFARSQARHTLSG